MDKQRRHNITIRLTESEIKELREMAKRENRSMANLIYKLIAETLQTKTGAPNDE